MNVTFLVTLDLPDATLPTLDSTATSIIDDLEGGGHAVVSVKEWKRPSISLPPSTYTTIPKR